MTKASPDIAIVGAGIAGAAAAYRLQQLGADVEVHEISSIPGGRMASLEIAGATFDHGAQFFTTRGGEFQNLVEEAANRGAARVWTHGFGDVPDGYQRWCGVPDMTAFARWLLEKSEATVRFDEAVTDLSQLKAQAIILTPPVPVSLSLAINSGLEPPSHVRKTLEAVDYKRTIAVLLVLNQTPLGTPATGAIQLLDDPYLAFISDNQAKGVSSLPALTVHLTNETSLELWEESDETIIHFTLDKLKTHLSNVDVASQAVTRWRYAGPVEVISDLSISWNSRPSLLIAGEAFNGPKVEGAFNSGIDAANKAIAGLSGGGGERCDE